MDPAERTLSSIGLGEIDTGGWGDGVTRLKLTLDSSLRNIPCFSSDTLCFSFSFPLLFAETVANSSAAGAGAFFERVAVRKVCSSEERMRLNGLIVGSWVGEWDEGVGCLEREEEAAGGGATARRW